MLANFPDLFEEDDDMTSRNWVIYDDDDQPIAEFQCLQNGAVQLFLIGNQHIADTDPAIVFSAKHAEILLKVGVQAAQRADVNAMDTAKAADESRKLPTPQIVAGPAANEGLNKFCLK